jgi:hypothetical protein
MESIQAFISNKKFMKSYHQDIEFFFNHLQKLKHYLSNLDYKVNQMLDLR